MDSRFSGFVLDPAKCCRLSLEEKRELVHQIAQWSKDAPEILSSFTRKELLEIICAEMGKERKYTGYTKLQMVDHLLKLVSQKSKRKNGEVSQKSKRNTENDLVISPAKTQTGSKRKWQKKPSTDLNHVPVKNNEESVAKNLFCQNVACRGALTAEDAFCKRCSCCVCHQYDENKDPSLWLTCGSESLNDKDSCGVSCHLKCALKDERAGIVKTSCMTKLEGSYYCVSCGKINGLMRTWRRQLLIAKETRRVDVLCLRISLSHKILMGTERYEEVQKTMDTALEMLKHEVGPLNLLCTKMARGIVKRLSCGDEVQQLCASAVEAFDSMAFYPCPDYIEKNESACCQIHFEDLSPTSVIIVLEYANYLLKDFIACRIWHRKSTMKDYPSNPTFIVQRPERRFKITDIDPLTKYVCKVSLFSCKGILGVWESEWVTPPSIRSFVANVGECREESNTIIHHIHSHVESGNSSDNELPFSDHPARLPSSEDTNKNKNGRMKLLLPPLLQTISLMSPTSISPSTPCKSTGTREVSVTGCRKRLKEHDYEYSVRAVKWLEHEGHIDEDFRVRFLTWFSLKATKQERKVVSVFVDVLIDDPPSLAGQLMHTFMDEICGEQKPIPGGGFCTNFWH